MLEMVASLFVVEDEEYNQRKIEMEKVPFCVRTSWPDCRSPAMSGVCATTAIGGSMCVQSRASLANSLFVGAKVLVFSTSPFFNLLLLFLCYYTSLFSFWFYILLFEWFFNCYLEKIVSLLKCDIPY